MDIVHEFDILIGRAEKVISQIDRIKKMKEIMKNDPSIKLDFDQRREIGINMIDAENFLEKTHTHLMVVLTTFENRKK